MKYVHVLRSYEMARETNGTDFFFFCTKKNGPFSFIRTTTLHKCLVSSGVIIFGRKWVYMVELDIHKNTTDRLQRESVKTEE